MHPLRQFVVGPPLPTSAQGKRRLNRNRARAAFLPEALTSIACANQEIFLGLVVAGSAGLALAFPAALAIVAVLLIMALSYDQTVHAYPSGGGAWIEARGNLGLGTSAATLLDRVRAACPPADRRLDGLPRVVIDVPCDWRR